MASFDAGSINARLSINIDDLEKQEPCLDSDIYIVFGASYIKSNLADFLIQKKAWNIHLGISPFYRGSSCNFWASYQGNHHLVGATIHLLSKRLDAGKILFHALPSIEENPFYLGMNAVKSAHIGVVEKITNSELNNTRTVAQDYLKEIKFSTKDEFNDSIAKNYLQHLPSKGDLFRSLSKRNLSAFINPYIINGFRHMST